VKTTFLEGQGLGNQLWVYASARAIAKRLKRPHVCEGFKQFKGQSFLHLAVDRDPAEIAPVEQFNEILFYDSQLKYFSSTYDIRVENLPGRVHLNGLFQSERYLSGYACQLRKWIAPSERLKNKALDFQQTCVLNLRGGEFKRHKDLILPKTYWEMALRKMRDIVDFDDILVVTDDIPYGRALFPRFNIFSGGVEECYGALMGAKSIIVSNSSFSYFPIKTRLDQPIVIAPEHWARFGHARKRWAMPANCYSDWRYLAVDGSLKRAEECIGDAQSDGAYYDANFSLRVSKDHKVGRLKTRFIPNAVKRPLKTVLSRLFPKRFG
jgi:hypothetical protein